MLELRFSWLALTCGALVVGCGSSSGAQNGSDGGDGGTQDGTTKGDGSHPRTDGSAGKDGQTADVGPGTDGKAPEGGTDAGTGASVLQHHMNANRDGHYIDPAMTRTHAAAMMIDPTFDGTISGPLWSQPLYVENGVKGKGTYYIADDNNDIYALDETTGKSDKDWALTPLAMAAGKAGSGCGNVNPVGVTGTPVIDMSTRTMYFSAAVGKASGIQSHEIYAISIDDGSLVKGWPIDTNSITSSSPGGGGIKFNPQPQGQRSALALVNGYLYVAYGGEDGDCGTYQGWVVVVKASDPTSVTAYATPAVGGGIWAVGGISSDGTDVFATTGNGTGHDTDGLNWPQAGTEAVLRFTNGSAFDTSNTKNFFTPSNWIDLDDHDTDLSGTGPLVIDVPGATPEHLVVQLGKSGVLHILDRTNLGGVGTGDGTKGEGLYSDQVADGSIRTAAASFSSGGHTYMVFNGNGNGSSCPTGMSGDLIAVEITATNPPMFNTIWCADSGGNGGAPIVTTMDEAGTEPIVWVVGAEGTNLLTAWDGISGMNIFNGGSKAMDNVIHWTTLIDVKGRLVVGASDKVYAFTSPAK